MEYITHKFENTPAGLRQKDEYTKQLAAEGYRITSEQIEQGHAKGTEQCCWALVCLPGIFLAARTPGFILVTYGREAVVAPVQLYCTCCGAAIPEKATTCSSCGVDSLGKSTPDQRAALQILEQKKLATAQTIEAQKSVQQLDRLLVDSLAVDYRFDWNLLVKKYSVVRPKSRYVEPLPKAPLWLDFAPKLSLVEKVVPSFREKRQEAARQEFLNAERTWKKAKEQNDSENTVASNEYLEACSEWDKQKKSYEEAQVAKMNALRDLYLSKDSATINGYCKTVVERSTPFTTFPKTHSYDYVPETHSLIVECDLPAIGCIPQVQEVRYDESRKALQVERFSDTWRHEFYNHLIYKISMRTMYVLFQSDAADALDSIVFNGKVRAVDRATGHEVNPCILSVQTRKAEFMRLNLAEIDPKACFKRLNGVSSENMIDLEPVVPISSCRTPSKSASQSCGKK